MNSILLNSRIIVVCHQSRLLVMITETMESEHVYSSVLELLFFLLKLYLVLIYLLTLCVCYVHVSVHLCLHMLACVHLLLHIEVRDQHEGVGSPLLPYRSLVDSGGRT